MADRHEEADILESWQENAAAWTRAVDSGAIRSRVEITDAAILDAIEALNPSSALDIGCGEGWLCRALARRGYRVRGVDAVPALVAAAQRLGGGEYEVLRYEELENHRFPEIFDLTICNFSLLGKESVDQVFAAQRCLLAPAGHFLVQTLHPLAAVAAGEYRDGWREGSWESCGEGFRRPAPWYFRTLESWFGLFHGHGFRLVELREPTGADGRPVSVIFAARLAGPALESPAGQAPTPSIQL